VFADQLDDHDTVDFSDSDRRLGQGGGIGAHPFLWTAHTHLRKPDAQDPRPGTAVPMPPLTEPSRQQIRTRPAIAQPDTLVTIAPKTDLIDVALRMFTTTHARDWPEFIQLIHPDAEIELRSQPGRVLRGREEMEDFARLVIASRIAHEATVHTIEQIGENAVAAIGRLSMTDDEGTRDLPIGWLMLFEDGMLRRSWLVPSIEAAQNLLSAYGETVVLTGT
jgi:hypothetical protein